MIMGDQYMSAKQSKPVVLYKFYSLEKLESQFNIDADDILRLAVDEEIDLYVPVPPGKRPFHVTLHAMNVRATHFGQDRYQFPDNFVAGRYAYPHHVYKTVAGLKATTATCARLLQYETAAQRLFEHAIISCSNPMFPEDGPFDIYMPLVSKVNEEDGDLEDVTENAAGFFGLYPDDMDFGGDGGKGYRAPDEIEITKKSMYISGFVLSKYLRDISPDKQDSIHILTKNQAEQQINELGKLRPCMPSMYSKTVGILFELSADHWGKIPRSNKWAAHNSFSIKMASLIRDKTEEYGIEYNKKTLAVSASIIRPGWSQRSGPKDQRVRTTFISCGLERIILVAELVRRYEEDNGVKPDKVKVLDMLRDPSIPIPKPLAGQPADAAELILIDNKS